MASRRAPTLLPRAMRHLFLPLLLASATACGRPPFADVVFTGGQSIYEAKRRLHKSIHPFPSSIDVAHFHKARKPAKEISA